VIAIESILTDPAGGFAEAEPRPAHRLQNPHMHFLEACLALHEAFPEKRSFARALDLRALGLSRFIDPDTNALLEFFEPDWRRAEGAKGERVEPGHQFEWVWLLDQCAVAAREDAPAPKRMRSIALGWKLWTRMAARLWRSIVIWRRSIRARRTWVQTETLKAHMASGAGERRRPPAARSSLRHSYGRVLTPEGGWIDHYDAEGHPVCKDMPASTGYHVVLAFDDMIQRIDRLILRAAPANTAPPHQGTSPCRILRSSVMAKANGTSRIGSPDGGTPI
jgi:mannose/cellobiose epimerase-like protein (N-acyl-D-glucosamine 2-epimerase family)